MGTENAEDILENITGNSTSKRCRKRKRNDKRSKERNKFHMRLLRAQNPHYREAEKLKRRINTAKKKMADIQDELQGVSNSTDLPKREKNKIAMQKRREYDIEYRMRENLRNKLAMRLKRSRDDNYRLRENERNKIAMQERRKQVRKLQEELLVKVEVEIKEEVEDA